MLGAGGGAGQQEGMGGPGPALGLCSWCEEKEKRSSYLSWFFKEVCAVHVVIRCCLWDDQGYLGRGHRATRVPCGSHPDLSQAPGPWAAVGLGCGPSPFPWQGQRGRSSAAAL